MPLFTPHPLLDIERCQQFVEEPTLDISQEVFHPDWQRHFLEMCQQCCDWNEETMVKNAAHLTRHIGGFVVYLRPVPENATSQLVYKNLYFWDGNTLQHIRETGEVYTVTLSKPHLFAEHLNKKKTSSSNIFLYFSAEQLEVLKGVIEQDIHIGSTPTYRHTAGLIHNLKIIYATLDTNPAPQEVIDQKAKILAPIADDIVFCTEGLYSRTTNTVATFQQPGSLSSLLTCARTTIVDNAVRTLTADVHWHAHAFNIAKKGFKFGVAATNAHDSQLRNNREAYKRIFISLKGAIDTNFRPFRLLDFLITEIKTVLVWYGYDNEKLQTNPSAEQYGYSKSQYDQFINYLQSILGPEINYSHLRMDEETQREVIDLNWLDIKIILWRRLLAENFFLHPDEFVDQCLQTNSPNPSDITAIFPDRLDFIQFLRCFPEIGSEKIKALIHTYLQHHTPQSSEEKQQLIQSYLPDINADDSPFIAFLCDYFKQHYWVELKNLMLPEIIHQSPVLELPNTIKILVGLIHELSPLEKNKFYAHCNNFIMSGLINDILLASNIIEVLLTLDPAHQIELFMNKDTHYDTPLLMRFTAPSSRPLLRRILNSLKQCQIHLGPNSVMPLLNQSNVVGINFVLYEASNLCVKHIGCLGTEETTSENTLSTLLKEEAGFSDIMSMLEALEPQQAALIFINPIPNMTILHAITYNAELLSRMLKVILRFEQPDQKLVLSSYGMTNYPYLLCTLMDEPELFIRVLQSICDNNDNYMYKLLKEESIYGDKSIFVSFTRKQPAYALRLLQLLSPLANTLKLRLIQGQDRYRNNFLMWLVLQEQPPIVPNDLVALLDILSNLSNQELAPLVQNKNTWGDTALMIAEAKQPASSQLLRTFIMGRILDDIIKNAFLSTIPSPTIIEHKDRLLQMVTEQNPEALREQFKGFAILVSRTTRPRSSLLFIREDRPLFTVLDDFGPALSQTLTGYESSSSIDQEVRPTKNLRSLDAEELEEPLPKKMRK